MEKSEYIRMFHLETNFWWYRILHELVDATVRKYKPDGEIRMLDAGCGTGRMMEVLQKYGTIMGIDYSEDAVHYAKERGLANVFQGDLNDYQFEKEIYDVIVCLDVLYHTGIRDDMHVVRKLKNSLKPEGILIINLPAFEILRRSHDQVVHTRKRYRKREFSNQLKEMGFTLLKSSYRLPHLYFIILISKIFKQNNKSEDFKSDLKELRGWANAALLFTGRIENCLLKKGFTFPVGSSLFMVVKNLEIPN